jgi:RNA methyltransferase, TrmH family
MKAVYMRKEILELLKDKKAMKDGGLFIVDTEKILGEAIAAGFEIVHFVYSESGLKIVDKYGDTMGHGVCETTKNSFIERFANVSTHQGFLAVVKSINREITSFDNVKKLVLLDNIQDPSNVGAILRSGTAFGFDNYLFFNCAGIYTDKVIRASAGAAFAVNYKNVDIVQIEKICRDFPILAADVRDGEDLRFSAKKPRDKFMIALGSEGQGLSQDVKNAAYELIRINYPGKVESLNVSAAAAVIFYELGAHKD